MPDGDHISIDPLICAGCGACSAVCPSGSIAYDMPPVDLIFQRLQTLGQAYRKAGGIAPRLLVHDTEHGREMIALAARYSTGLPSDVIPLEVSALSGFGHTEMLSALACGFAQVSVLMAPRSDHDVLHSEQALAQAIAPANSLHLLDI